MPKTEKLPKSLRSHKQSHRHRHHHPQPLEPRPTQTPVTAEQGFENLRQLLLKQFQGKDPRPFQIEVVRCQQERRDTLCHAATGMGKTAVAAGPYAIPENKDRVTLMVSPLIGLQNEMVCGLSCTAFTGHLDTPKT
jgi:superfamily II DNA helicase RecQ